MYRFAGMALATVALFATATITEAAKLKPGDPAPIFRNLETTDGKTVSSSDFQQDVLVVCITCNHCPVAVAYEDRMIEFVSNSDKEKVAFVAINVNNLESDKLPAMKRRAKTKGFNFVYAYDPSQRIARELGASVTPEYYVFNKERKLVYQGAMDDDMNASKVETKHLEQAVKATLNGSTAPRSTRARGCGIKYER